MQGLRKAAYTEADGDMFAGMHLRPESSSHHKA
jgi:hypothetical protein